MRSNKTKVNWTLCILTLPSRINSMLNLLMSLKKIEQGFNLNILYVGGREDKIHKLIYNTCKGIKNIHNLKIKWKIVTITEGRNVLLKETHTDLIAFIDDDISFSRDILKIVDKNLKKYPLVLLGIKSYINNTNRIDKPRRTQYPYIRFKNFLLGPVFGIFVGGYTKVIKKIGGFDSRRKDWGEWVDLNFRLLNKGFAMGYLLRDVSVRHWTHNLDSPTRNKKDRHYDIIRGISLTAIDYNLTISFNNNFWKVVFSRYLNYAYDKKVTKEKLFFDTIKVFNQLIREDCWFNNINKEYKYIPYEEIKLSEWLKLLESSEKKLKIYKSTLY